MAKKPKVGEPARKFVLDDQNGKAFDLSKFSGKKVLLSFHPLAWTPVCAIQMKSLERNKKVLDSLDTVAVGISVDSIPCKKAWAKSLSIKNTRLLCDFWPHGKVVQLYGLFLKADGISGRANVIIDKEQRVALVKIYPMGKVPDMRKIIKALRKMP